MSYYFEYVNNSRETVSNAKQALNIAFMMFKTTLALYYFVSQRYLEEHGRFVMSIKRHAAKISYYFAIVILFDIVYTIRIASKKF